MCSVAWKYFNFEKSGTLFIRIDWKQHLVAKIKTDHPNNFFSLLGCYSSEDSLYFEEIPKLHKILSTVESAVPFSIPSYKKAVTIISQKVSFQSTPQMIRTPQQR